jgi:hypothetical protein
LPFLCRRTALLFQAKIIYDWVLEITDKQTQTEGAWRVGTTFNPSASGTVDEVKRRTAELIDMLEGLKSTSNDPRSIAKAQTDFEQAAMWAVKGITKTKKA